MLALQGVHIVSVGVRCAVGFTAESAAAAIRARISRLREHPLLEDAAGDKIICARDPVIEPDVPVPVRMALFTQHAVGEVLTKIVDARSELRAVSVLLAVPETRPGFAQQDLVWLQRLLASPTTFDAVTVDVQQVGQGHAGALLALQTAVERVSRGETALCVAGGVDSYLDAETVQWLESDRRVARPGIRSGFAPGEGAAAVAVASEGECRRLQLPSLGRVCSVACAQERRSADSEEGLFGEALTEVVRRATGGLHAPDELVDDVYCDINGERARTEDWGFTLARTGTRFHDGTSYVTQAGECGDMGAATGALGCALAVESWRRRYARGPRALVVGGSWGGLRAAALLAQVSS